MKELNRRDFIKGAFGLGAVSALTALTGVSAFAEDKKEGAIYTPGTYTASAMGREGEVVVTVTFDETHITDVVIDASAETPAIGGVAAEALTEQVKTGQRWNYRRRRGSSGSGCIRTCSGRAQQP